MDMVQHFKLIELAIIVLVTLLFLRGISKFQMTLLHRKNKPGHLPIDRTTAAVIARLLRIGVMITALLVTLQSLGYHISGLLAIGGAGTIIAGLAAKDLLANFFGGLMIYLDRPFLEGDWIRSPDRDIEGYVEHIGWRLTRILTFEHRPIYIPNSIFANIIVENPSRMSHRRIEEDFGLRYDDVSKLPLILQDIRQMLRDHSALDKSELCSVHFLHFGEKGLSCKVRAFTYETTLEKYLEVQENVFFQIIDILKKHSASLASSSMIVSVPEGLVVRSTPAS